MVIAARNLLAALGACTLSACSVTADVHGVVGGQDNAFTGKATGYMDGTGSITLNNGRGVECLGSFAYANSSTGAGELTCNDGQRAEVRFNAITMSSGYGFGISDKGQPIRFAYGLSPIESQKYLQIPPATSVVQTPPPSVGPASRSPMSSVTKGTGSGFIVSRDGHLLTNHHVVDGCERVRVALPGRPAELAATVGQDKTNDLALLKLEIRASAVASFRGERAIRQGDSVVVYGFPFAGALSSNGNITSGSVSALAGLRDDARFLQISAPVQPGNSGGPLLDASGNVVGVVTSTLNAIKVAGITGDIPQNVNFALKAPLARVFLEASGIDVQSAPSNRTLTTADVGDRARAVTALVECLN